MKEKLESINDELFNSFDPDNELWIVGGDGTAQKFRYLTHYNGYTDVMYDEYDD